MPDKRDWLGECNEHNVPLGDFKLQFCDSCLTQDCTRSQYGKSKFEARVHTWEQRLFLETPTMEPTDPRYEKIHAQKFINIEPGGPLEIGQSAWIDPLDPLDPLDKTIQSPQIEPILQSNIPEPEPLSEPEIKEPTIEKSELKNTPEQVTRPVMFTATNTPNKPGQMVGEPPKVPEKQKQDPWEPPKPVADDEEIVKPGAKIRFGGG
jgi:hypothetical protein